MTIEQLDFTNGLARATDPETSKAAATALRPESLRYRLLRTYASGVAQHMQGLTDEEATALANVGNGGWKRCSDLRRAGLIQPTGRTKPGRSSGRDGRICAITEAGREALR